MRTVLAIAMALSMSLSGAALGQPSGAPGGPTTLPANPGRPPSGRPPSGAPRPPSYRPPVYRPPYASPNPWRHPTSSSWYWHGRWVNRVHGPPWAYPRGYAYRRWYRGDLIPALFLTATYFYTPVAALGLQTAPPGYRWIRYGTDLLLVNLATGRVEDVAYGVFF